MIVAFSVLIITMHTMYLYVGIVDSFQEVDLGIPAFSDVVVNGKELEAASSISVKSEGSEEQSDEKATDKSVSLQLNSIIKCFCMFPCRCPCH